MPTSEDLLFSHKNALEQFAEDHGLAHDAQSVASRYQNEGQRIRTVTLSSIEAYKARGLNLLNQFVKTYDASAIIKSTTWPELLPSPAAWVKWLTSVKMREVSATSWRLYRRSAIETLHLWPEANDEIPALIEELTQAIHEKEQTPTQRKLRRIARAMSSKAKTSGKRLRFIAPTDLAAILAYCYRPNAFKSARMTGPDQDQIGYALADMLVSSIAVGLRPCEWRQSQIVYEPPRPDSLTDAERRNPKIDIFWRLAQARMKEPDLLVSQVWPAIIPFKVNASVADSRGRVWLVTYNAKHSNNRGNMATRSIEITGCPLHVKLSILRMIVRGKHYLTGGEWTAFQHNVRIHMNRVNSAVFPTRSGRITLYSGRHQAMANIKAKSGTFNAAVIAGHGYSDTPDMFYETRRFAWSRRWEDIIQMFLAGEIDDFADLLTNENIKIESDGRLFRRKRKKGKGGFGIKKDDPAMRDTLALIKHIVSGLAEMPTPGVLTAEVKSLEARDAKRQATYNAAAGIKEKIRRKSGPSANPN